MGSTVSFYLIQPRPHGYFRCKEEGREREVLSFPHLKNPGNEVVPDYVPLNKICKCNLKLMVPIKKSSESFVDPGDEVDKCIFEI